MKDRSERFRYLKELVEEFHTSHSMEAKQQVLANLTNFAYDPGNAEFLVRLRVPGLFVSVLECVEEVEGSDLLWQFASAGVCNICQHPPARSLLLDAGVVPLLTKFIEEFDSGDCVTSADVSATHPTTVRQLSLLYCLGTVYQLLTLADSRQLVSDAISSGGVITRLTSLAENADAKRLQRFASLILAQVQHHVPAV